jgi:hypothetical protein
MMLSLFYLSSTYLSIATLERYAVGERCDLKRYHGSSSQAVIDKGHGRRQGQVSQSGNLHHR